MAIEISTTIVGSGQITLPPYSSVRISYESTQPQVQMVITNLHSGGSNTQVYICDSQGNEAIAVWGESSITLETDSAFVVKNPLNETVYFLVCRLIARGAGLVSPLHIVGTSGKP